MSVRIGRRLFLEGTGGLLAMPLLESLWSRPAHAAVAPRRFLLMTHRHGRLVGTGRMKNGVRQDIWAPSNTSGPLTETMSPFLAPLAPIRQEVVTIDAVDNLVRHLATGVKANDGHLFPTFTYLTARNRTADGKLGGPSIDYVVGERLRGSAARPASIVLCGNTGNSVLIQGFGGANGTAPNVLDSGGNAAMAISKLFAGVQPTMMTTPTVRSRLQERRGLVLDGVEKDYQAIRSQLGTADRARIDQHLTFLADTKARLGSGPPAIPGDCRPMNGTEIPAVARQYSYSSAHDDAAIPVLIDAVVRALVCDITRSMVLTFPSDVPTFDFLYPGGSPFLSDVWHTQIHMSGDSTVRQANNVKPTGIWYAQVFTSLVQKLAAVTDVDGNRLLDNTLVLWVSDLGYGPNHYCHDIPVVMAGLKSAFPKGQGRHVVAPNRASLGDLYAQVLRMFGGTDTTFGATGTLASVAGVRTQTCDNGIAWCADHGYPGFITPDTPLHLGPLDL